MTLMDASDTALDQVTFRTIADLAYRESGLTLVAEKAPMVQSRLRHRLHSLGLADFAQYATYLTSDDGVRERRQLISALTTNVSHFFREDHHFDVMIDVLNKRLPDLKAGAPFRIWHAGCSQGQEPLSAAIALTEAFSQLADYDLRILATDIDPKVVTFAKAGLYDPQTVRRMPDTLRQRYFQDIVTEDGAPMAQASADLMSLIRYREHNLLGPWPMTRAFDIIFCRNTVIYFDAQTQDALWPRFREIIKPHGRLFLGHSERINTPELVGFHCCGPTTYEPVNS